MSSQRSVDRGVATAYGERQRLWTVGRQLLESTVSEQERREGALLVTQAMALPPGVELDESLCQRAGIPLEWLEELRGPQLRAA